MRKDSLKTGDRVAFWPQYGMPSAINRGVRVHGFKSSVTGMIEVEVISLAQDMEVPAGKYTSLMQQVQGIRVKIVNPDDGSRLTYRQSHRTYNTIEEEDGSIYLDLRDSRKLIMPWAEFMGIAGDVLEDIAREKQEEQAREKRRAESREIFDKFFGVELEDYGDEFSISDDDMATIIARLPSAEEVDMLRKFALKVNHRADQEAQARAILRRLLKAK